MGTEGKANGTQMEMPISVVSIDGEIHEPSRG